jgi:murein DD-endopeptidase MepM/ murein hydrolase activator NlpD
VHRRFTANARPVLVGLAGAFLLPVLVGAGLKWSAQAEIEQLRTTTAVLELENRSFRATTGALTTQLQSLQHAITDIGQRAAIDPKSLKAMERLPALVKASAVGGPSQAADVRPMYVPGLNTPDDTFGVLRDLLYSLEARLGDVRTGVERREALAAATPTIWPAEGWLTDSFGGRSDPFTGEPAFHGGLDISTEKGQPVYATANGTVRSAEFAGAYGKMVIVDHGFGLTTRYAHLHAFTVEAGDLVRRGDVVGLAGSTGRATGDHVHYEVLANGQILNPLRFLTDRLSR